MRLVAIAGGLTLIGHPATIWIIAFAYSAGSQVFSPAEMVLVREVQGNAASRAHAVLVVLQYAGQGAGALCVPVLALLGGPHALLLGASLVFFALTAVTVALAFQQRRGPARTAMRAGKALSLAEPLRFIGREPRAVYAVVLLVFTDIATKDALIAVPRYLQGDLGLARWAVAVLVGAGAIGALLGLLGSGRVCAARAMRLMFVGAVVALLAFVSLGQSLGEASEHSGLALLTALAHSPSMGLVAILPAALLLGLCLTAGPIGARALLTEIAPTGQQARVFAAQTTLTHALSILPLLFAGASAQFAGPRTSLALIGVLGLAAALVLESVRVRGRSLVASAV